MDSGYAGLAGAMSTAIEGAFRLDTVANDFTITMLALWGERVDGAFETIENMRDAAHPYLKALIVYVAAYFTSHTVCLTSSFVHNLPLSSTIARTALS